MKRVNPFDAAHTGISDPNRSVRAYDLSGGLPLVALLDNPWYPPYVLDRPHVHNCMEIGVCLYGVGRVAIGGRSWRFREGSVVVAPRGVEHMQNNEGEPMTHWRYVIVNVEAWVDELPARLRPAARDALGSIPGGAFMESGSTAERFAAIIDDMFRRHTRCRSLQDLELDGSLRVLLSLLPEAREGYAEVAFPPAHRRQTIEPALQYVSRNYAQEVRVEDMAASCAMSESYFRKTFSAIMGMPPLEYLNRFRVNRSVHLLSTSDDTVMTIAGMVGFPSIATYNRNFRRYVGQSPAQWRKNALD